MPAQITSQVIEPPTTVDGGLPLTTIPQMDDDDDDDYLNHL
jgi:hypothetical protein